MTIKVLGAGCAKCKLLEAMTRDAVRELGIDVQVEKVTDIQKIMSYGVMSTPALVINEKVKVAGRVPGVKNIKQYIEEER